MIIVDALGRFLTQLEADGRSVHTRNQFKRHGRLLATWAAGEGITKIEQLSHEVIARFLGSKLAPTRPDGREKRGTAMNCLRGSVRGFARFLHQAGVPEQRPWSIGPPRALQCRAAASHHARGGAKAA
jgi:site-specific recombinase XerC